MRMPDTSNGDELKMKIAATALALLASTAIGTAFADEGTVPLSGIPQLDHVFVIMMENHGYGQVINNPNEPYLNGPIANKSVNLATNYFAIGHPSLTNYLEIVGGSNFGVRSDNAPAWHSTSCSPNLATGIPNAETAAACAGPIDTGNICPIAGTGTDAATPAIDNRNERPCRRFLTCRHRRHPAGIRQPATRRQDHRRPARRRQACRWKSLSGKPAGLRRLRRWHR